MKHLSSLPPDELRAQLAEARAANASLQTRCAELDQDRRHYRWLAESTTDLISRHARDGTFLYASHAARDLLGYEPQELVGASAYDLFHPDDLHDLLTKSPRVYHRNGFYRHTYRFRAKQGHYVWFETTSRTRRHPATGELIDILSVSRDVGLRKAAEAQAHRHQEQIAHANRLASTGELASNIAHELNQPLAAIANYISVAQLKLNANPEAPLSNLELLLTRINDQVSGLAERLRHIRSFVRKGQIRTRPMPLSEAVEGACRLCEWQFRQADIDIESQLADNMPRVLADPVALQQVLVNLLLNALEASRGQPGASRVMIEAELHEPAGVTFRVRDFGRGVDPTIQEQLFSAFHTTREEGLGLGLPISHSLMEAMGGGLWLAPAATSEGTVFAGTLRCEPSLRPLDAPKPFEPSSGDKRDS